MTLPKGFAMACHDGSYPCTQLYTLVVMDRFSYHYQYINAVSME